MHSISDLTTFCRKTTGDVPPKLVGASTTVVGSNMYLFGGRLVTERRMVSDLYVFNLETFAWEMVVPAPEDDIPGARYFHSADSWNNHLVIFGGMGINPESNNPEDLCVLNDVRFFDISTRRWIPTNASRSPALENAGELLQPKARYAHLSSVTDDRLFIIGGQDLANVWLDDIYVFDMRTRTWIARRDYPRHCGTYRSVAVSSALRVRQPQDELKGKPSKLGPPGSRFKSGKTSKSPDHFTSSESLVHLPYSAAPSSDYPNDIFLYSNYNFTDVKRELEVFTPQPGRDFTISDRSSAMNGTAFPPGLRFPTGAILGTHLIIAGTYLAHTYQSFSVWALDLITMSWSRIDPGSALSTGSWFRGCLWAESNKFLIFGNRHGNLVEDYNRRLLSWEHVACIDLEAFGIYQAPRLALDIPMQELGLAALEEGILADFEIICDDGRKIKCSRKCLEDRWPWLKQERKKFLHRAERAIETMPRSSQHVPIPELSGVGDEDGSRPDPRLTPRSLHLSEPYPVTLALLQYFYTLALITPLQHAPAVLSQLLILSITYKLTHLEGLVKHAMHRALSNSTSVGVYEVATLCSCRSLQIRALKTVMSYSQKRPIGRTRDQRGNGGGGGLGGGPHGGDGGGYSSSGGGGGTDTSSAARPRGMSDAFSRSASSDRLGNLAASRGYTISDGGRPLDSPIDRHMTSKSPNSSPSSLAKRHIAVSPSAIHKRPDLSRSNSTVRKAVDNEIQAVAELMSPCVEGRQDQLAEEQEATGTPIDDSTDSEVDTLLPDELEHKRAIRVSFSSSMKSGILSNRRSSFVASSVYSVGSDHGEWQADTGGERSNCESPSSDYRSYQLPRVYTSDSDAPSLTTRASSSSINSSMPPTPNRLSVSSLLLPISPPVSPSALKPVEPVQLAVIPERNLEDDESQYGISIEYIQGSASFPTASPLHRGDVLSPTPPSNVSAESVDTVRPRRLPAKPGQLILPAVADCGVSRWDRSPTPSSSSGSGTASPRSAAFGARMGVGAAAFSRFLSKGDRDQARHQASSPIMDDSISDKAWKAEEKKRKKQEAKERTERLALELKMRTAERKAAQEAQPTSPKAPKDAVMYGGMVWS